MPKKIIKKNTYSVALDCLIEEIKANKQKVGAGLDTRHIVIVPDKYTMAVERRLLGDGAGATFDIEVVTLNRLFGLLWDGDEQYLSKQGALLYLKKATEKVKDKLVFFGRSIKYAGFFAKMYEIITQLQANKIEPTDLVAATQKAVGAAKFKFGDIGLIYGAYQELTLGRFIDAGGRLKLLEKIVRKHIYFDNTYVYVANFDVFTKRARGIIDILAERTNVTVYSTEDKALTATCLPPTTLYNAKDSVDELKEIAKRIRYLVSYGMRYKDMALVRTNINAGQIKRIFGEFDIPYYADAKIDLARHPLGVFLLAVLDFISASGLKEATAVIRSQYFFELTDKKIDNREIDSFVTACIANSVDYGDFEKPWTIIETPHLAEYESVRQALISLIAKLPGGTATASEWSNKLAELISNADDTTVALGHRAGVDYKAVTNKVRQSIALAGELYSDENMRATEFGEVLKLLLSGAEVSPLSPSADCVIVGGPEIFRGTPYKAMFVSGFNEGVLPNTLTDSGIITDDEIDGLGLAGLSIEPKVKEVNDRAKTELKQLLMCGHDRLFLSWTSVLADGTEGRKPQMLEVLEQTHQITQINPDEIGGITLQGKDLRDHAAELAYMASARKNCERELIAYVGGAKSPLGVPYYDAIYSALSKKNTFNPYKYIAQNADLDYRLFNADKMFFSYRRTKVSQLESYFSCPYLHFAEYGLRLKERKTGGVLPVDVGNILHEAIDKWLGLDDFDDVPKQTAKIIDQILAERPKSFVEANEGLLCRLKKECIRIAEIITFQIKNTKFVNLGREMEFKYGCGDLEFVGKIDRVDEYDKSVRIIDYKSGKIELKASDLYYGKKLQLFIYMYALMGEGYYPAGVFYFPFKDEFGDKSDDYRMVGVYAREYATAHDIGLEQENFDSTIIKAGTKSAQKGKVELHGNKSRSALDIGTLRLLCDYASKISQIAVKEISSGNITPSPYKGVCEYCKCGDICQVKDKVTQRGGGKITWKGIKNN